MTVSRLCGGGRPPSVVRPRTLHVTPRLGDLISTSRREREEGGREREEERESESERERERREREKERKRERKEREREWFGEVAPHSLRQILWCVDSSLMEPCRYDMGCWRPLCPYGHSWRRAVRWAALWSFLAMQEEGDENLEEIKERVHEHIVEQTVDVPVPQIAT